MTERREWVVSMLTEISGLITASERLGFAMEDARISAGRLWLAIYLSKPWYRRLLIDIRRWFR